MRGDGLVVPPTAWEQTSPAPGATLHGAAADQTICSYLYGLAAQRAARERSAAREREYRLQRAGLAS